jgi:hypothetical protein
LVELQMFGELGAIVEGDGFAQGLGHGFEQAFDAADDGLAALEGVRAAMSRREWRSCRVRMAWP